MTFKIVQGGLSSVPNIDRGPIGDVKEDGLLFGYTPALGLLLYRGSTDPLSPTLLEAVTSKAFQAGIFTFFSLSLSL